MPVGATIGGAVITGGLGYYGANKASKQQQAAAQRAEQMQLAMYNEAKGYQQPYMETGKGAVYSLAQLYGIPTPGNPNPGQPFGQESIEAFKRSPDYKFAFDEGHRALQFSAAGKHMLKSGNLARGLVDYGQGAATQNFGNYRAALENMARLGSGAATSLTGAGQGYAGNLGNAAMAYGQAGAAGTVGGINAITSAIGSGVNNYNTLAMYNQMKSAYQPYGYPHSGVSPTGASLFPPPVYGGGGIGHM